MEGIRLLIVSFQPGVCGFGHTITGWSALRSRMDRYNIPVLLDLRSHPAAVKSFTEFVFPLAEAELLSDIPRIDNSFLRAPLKKPITNYKKWVQQLPRVKNTVAVTTFVEPSYEWFTDVEELWELLHSIHPRIKDKLLSWHENTFEVIHVRLGDTQLLGEMTDLESLRDTPIDLVCRRVTAMILASRTHYESEYPLVVVSDSIHLNNMLTKAGILTSTAIPHHSLEDTKDMDDVLYDLMLLKLAKRVETWSVYRHSSFSLLARMARLDRPQMKRLNESSWICVTPKCRKKMANNEVLCQVCVAKPGNE